MKVIAHRASAPNAPENSLEGIARAADLGVDAVEIDVRLTRDGHPVILHDPLPWRTARRAVPVRLLTLEQFRHLHHRGSGAPLPTLHDALEALPPGVGAAIDVKDEAATGAVLSAVDDLALGDRAMVWIRDADAVGVAARRLGRERVALLHRAITEAGSRGYLREAVAAGAGQVSIHQHGVTEALVDEAHELGLTAWSWVIRRDAHRRVVATGVDGVVTDWPELARRTGDERGEAPDVDPDAVG